VTRLTGARLLAIVAVAFSLANAAFAGRDQGETVDERFHLMWPQRLLDQGEDERWSAFRLDSKTPAYVPAVVLQRLVPAWRDAGAEGLRRAGRVWSLLIYASLLAGVFVVMRRVEGGDVAWTALALVALEPNLAAAASIATTDGAYALAAFVACAAALTARPGLRAASTGAALGLAFSVKYAAPLLVPLLVFVVARDARERRIACAARSLALATAALLVVVAIAYLGVGLFVPIGAIRFESDAFRSFQALWPELRLPVPRALLTGLDMSIRHDREWTVYAFGRTWDHPVPWYFAAHAALKTPVLLLVAAIAGLWRARRLPSPWMRVWFTMLAVHALYFSLLFRTQIGYRFVLVCLPLALCLAAKGLAAGPRAPLLAVVAALSLAERAPYFSDPIAFTGALVQPKARAWWYVGDSNLDYGQNRSRLDGMLVRARIPDAVVDPPSLTSGPTVLSGNRLTVADRDGLGAWLFRNEAPVRRIGFTHFEFSIDADLFERYMDDLRTVRFAGPVDEICGGEFRRHAPGARIPIERLDGPRERRVTLVCASNRRGGDVGFLLDENRAWFGRLASDRRCVADLVERGEQTWFRLAPDAPAVFCLVEEPFRRAFLPYELRGHLAVRGRGADILIRPADGLGVTLAVGADRSLERENVSR
jgi:hypothetical protein